MPYLDSLDWLNLNSLRNYPIRQGVSKLDNASVFTIPNDLIVDFQLAATSTASVDFFVSQITNEINQIVIQISDSSSVVVGTFTINTSAFTQNTDILLQTVPGAYQYANGKITIGSIATIQTLPVGIYFFSFASTSFEPRTINLSLSGINAITFLDSNGTFQTLTGTVNIVARNNLRYSYDTVNNYLVLDAGDGLGLNTTCSVAPCVQSINGVTPDPTTGNISFIGVGCSSISTLVAATIQINDTCCTPCSGCDDLAELTSRLNTLESQYLNLQNLYRYLQSELGVYLSTVNSNCVCTTNS